MTIFKLAMALLVAIFPWRLKRWVLNRFYNCQLEPSARIGLSLVLNTPIAMAENSRIGHLNIIKDLQKLALAQGAAIGNLNYISAVPANSKKHFHDEDNRAPELILGEYASIVGRHFFDCSNRITIGAYAIIAGLRTSFFTHGIDIVNSMQRSAPINIGKHSMVGTCCVLLKGANLPDNSTLAANSTLHKAFQTPYRVYSGVPAAEIKSLPEDSQFFSRTSRFVQ